MSDKGWLMYLISRKNQPSKWLEEVTQLQAAIEDPDESW